MRSVQQAQSQASRRPVLPPTTYSHFMLEITRLAEPQVSNTKKPTSRRRSKTCGGVAQESGVALRRSVTTRGRWKKNTTTDTATGYTNRRDWQSKAMGMGPSFAFATATGTATAATATTLTNSGAAFTTAGQALAGQIVAVGANSAGAGSIVYGVIVSNTATVLTVDQWYNPASATGAAGTTPNATGQYQILPGQNPASWLALSSSAAAPTSADTTLATEATTNGFARAVGSYSHTAAATTYSLVKTFTAAGSLTVNTEAVFGAANPTAGGVMPFAAPETSPPVLISGDTLAQTVTITIN